MAYMGPNFISADFNGFDMYGDRHNTPQSATQSRGVEASSAQTIPPKVKPKKPPAVPPEGPGLRGATMPHCTPGHYTAGYECKIAPPDHYVPVGAIYPIKCPAGTRAAIGAQSKGQCIKIEVEGELWVQGKGLIKSALAAIRLPI